MGTRSGCSQFCSCEKPPTSTSFLKSQQARCICLKRKRQKTSGSTERPETALGTGGRIISFNSLQIDHLSKQQVIGS
jgi:hypothetical protein